MSEDRCLGCAALKAGTTGYFIDSISHTWLFDDLVVIARGNTPDPIPNSAVKTLSADGTPS